MNTATGFAVSRQSLVQATDVDAADCQHGRRVKSQRGEPPMSCHSLILRAIDPVRERSVAKTIPDALLRVPPRYGITTPLSIDCAFDMALNRQLIACH